MMNVISVFLRCVVVCLLCIYLVSCAVDDGGPTYRYVKADELRDHPGHCFDSNRCTLRRQGESWTVDKTCESATCHMSFNGTMMEKRTRCESILPNLTEDCYIVRVEGKPYPDCCPRLICEDKLPKDFFFRK